MAIYGGIEDYQILQHYLSPYHNKGELKPGVNIQNPFILDKQSTPSFGIGKGVEGDYIYKDFATGHQGTAVNLVMDLFGLNFMQAIQRIERDFGTEQYKPKKYDAPEEKPKAFTIAEKEFTKSDLEFWGQGNINPIVSGILCFASYKRGDDERAVTIKATDTDPIFAYKISDDCYKIYRPFSVDKAFKFGWLGNKPKDYVYGYDRLPKEGEIAILCAGEKDTETAIAFGFNAICLNSETAMPSQELLFDLNSRFKILACCYDIDKTGIEQSNKLKKLGFAPIELPNELLEYGNDLFDFAKYKDKFDVTFAELVDKVQSYNKYAIFNKPYKMSFELDVPHGAVTVKFKGATFLKKGNVATIVAGAGIGKSQTADAISSLVLNGNVDALGFTFIDDNIKNILHVDTERDPDDHKLGYLNVFRRANEETKDSDKLDYWSYKMNETPKANRTLLENMLVGKSYDLVILDGIGDFIEDINDSKECSMFANWLTIFAQRNDTSIIVTVHENINSNGRANGHLGTLLWKKSYGMVRLQSNKEDQTIKEITNEFDLGKLRAGTNGGAYIYSYFRWDNSENVNMYVSLSDDDVNLFTKDNKTKKTPRYYLEKIFFNNACNFTKAQITVTLSEDYLMSGGMIDKMFKDWASLEYIKQYNGIYSLATPVNNKIPDGVVSGFEEDKDEPPF